MVNVVVKAVAGATKTAETAVIYDSTSTATASFSCTGATLTYKCVLNGENETFTTEEESEPTIAAASQILKLDNGNTLSASATHDAITYVAHVAKESWMGIGYGTSMTQTDEVMWAAGADVKNSSVYDVFSVGPGFPSVDTDNLYTTTMVENGDFIDFTSTRPLTPPSSDPKSFSITLDHEIDMIWAHGSYASASGFMGCGYHQSNKSIPGW